MIGPRILKNRDGFTQPDIFIPIAIIIILAVIAIPQFIKYQSRVQTAGIEKIEKLAKNLQKPGVVPKSGTEKWTNLELKTILPSTDPGELVCPVTDKPYEFSVKGSEWKLCCPDPDNHLGIGDEKSCRTNSGWIHGRMSPVKELKINNSFTYIKVEVDESSTLTVTRKANWIKFLLTLSVVIAVLYLSDLFLDKKWARGPVKSVLDGFATVSAFALVFCFFLLIFLLVSNQYSFSSDGTFETKKYVGPIRISHDSFSAKDILAVGQNNGVFFLLKDEKGNLNRWFVKTNNEDDANKLAAIIRGRVFSDKKQ